MCRHVPRPSVLAVLLAAVLGALALAAPASAAPGSWGPDSIPYLDGVLCPGDPNDTATTVLAAWPGPSGDPAFALGAITAAGGIVTEPAVLGGTTAALPAGPVADQAGALAYLISAHGGDTDPAVVADVAARVVEQDGAGDAGAVQACLAGGVGGTSAALDDQLWTQAQEQAGPYSVAVTASGTTLRAGQPLTITAQVSSAAGQPVGGMTVEFSGAAGSLLAAPSAVTDATGRARVQVGADPDADTTSTRVTATVSAVAGLVQTSAPAAVPMISVAAAQTFTGATPLIVDTRPDPVLTLRAGAALVLAGADVTATLGVTGLHGHAGTATVTAYGPLPVSSATGCGQSAADWAAERAARRTGGSVPVSTVGDSSTRVTVVAAAAAGCYQLDATISVTDSTPPVSRSITGPVVGVVPVRVVATGRALSGPGAVQDTVVASGKGFALSWQDSAVSLLGPLPVGTDRSCPLTGWRAGGRTATTTGSAATLHLVSAAVTQPGCYAFRLTGTLAVAGLGALPVSLSPGAGDAPVLVISPTVTASALSASGVHTGGTVTATVDVQQTMGQPGTVHLELAHLPYTFRGCYGQDWRNATIATPDVAVPGTRTGGDMTVSVRSAAVPGDGCWTVVPVFTAAANPAVRASGTAGADPMLAFTGLGATPVDRRPQQSTAPVGRDSLRMMITGGVIAVLLLLASGRTVYVARRVARAEY